MRRTDNGVAPRSARTYRLPEDGPLPDLPLYERLIGDGIAAADSQGTAVDHLTARRLAIWLAARPQSPVFALWGSGIRLPVLTSGFYAARSYSLRRPPRTVRRLIRSWERSATGWS